MYSIDVNPCAVRYMQDNIRLNRAYAKIVCLHGDAKEIVETNLHNAADLVPMPLPEKNPLLYAMSIVSPQGGWRLVHHYEFECARKRKAAIEKVVFKVSKRLQALNVAFNVSFGRIVRTTGPNWYQVVLDVQV